MYTYLTECFIYAGLAVSEILETVEDDFFVLITYYPLVIVCTTNTHFICNFKYAYSDTICPCAEIKKFTFLVHCY